MNQDTTMTHDDSLAIVLGQRQLVAVCCMFLVVIGLVSTLAYVAGRSITAAQFRVSDRMDTPPPIIVDPRQPARAPVVAQAATPAPAMEKTVAPVALAQAQTMPTVTEAAKPSPFGAAPTQAAAPVKETAPPVKETAPPVEDLGKLTDPAAGTAFFQVGSVERPMARTFADYLSEQGFKVRMAPGASESAVRVLVGPLVDEGEANKVHQALDAAGFQHFLKRY